MLRSISEQSRKSVESVLIAVASRLVAGYSNPGSIHFFAGIGHGQAKIEFLFKSMHRLCTRGVHGNGEDWDPMGPMGFPWEWE